MARVSKEELIELQKYGYNIGLTDSVMALFKESYEKFVTREQMDALLQAQNIMSSYADAYYIAKFDAPKNAKRERAKFEKLYVEVEDKELLISEWRAFSYHKSRVMEIRSQAKDEAREVLEDSGMGKDKIEEALALLYTILTDEENLTPIDQSMIKFLQNL